MCTSPQQAGREAQHKSVGAEHGVVPEVRRPGDCDIAERQGSLAQGDGNVDHLYSACVQSYLLLKLYFTLLEVRQSWVRGIY